MLHVFQNSYLGEQLFFKTPIYSYLLLLAAAYNNFKYESCFILIKKRLLLQLKSLSASGKSCDSAFMGNFPTFSHTPQPYLPRLFCLFLVQMNEIKILGESKVFHFLSDVNQGNEGENAVSVVQKIPLSLFWSKLAQLNACDVFVDDQGNDGWFLFYQRLILLWVIGVVRENTCTVSGKSNFSRVHPKLYGWV